VTSPSIGPALQLTKNVVSALGGAGANRQLTLLQTPLFNPFSSPLQLASSVPGWFKLTENLSYAAFFTAGLSFNLPLVLLPGAGVVHGIKIIHSTAFTGPSISGYTISVGTSNNPSQLASAFDVTSTPSSTNSQLSLNFITYDDVNATTLIAQALSSGANLNTAVSGQVDIYALLSVSR
jgi:hypothetical protein